MRVPKAVKDHLRHNVVGYIALFCFAIGGTAIALPGKKTVDSGDIRPKAVHASDIAKEAVTGPKLRKNAVGSAAVLDNSLTGADIDESTLSRPGIVPGSVGPLEEADRERRIVVPAGSLFEGSASPSSQSPFAAIKFDDLAHQTAYLSIEVPGGRVDGTPLNVRLIWTAGEAGNVLWEIAFLAAGVGDTTNIEALPERVVSSTTKSIVTATSLTIPGDEAQNGDLLGLEISRNGANSADTLEDSARLHLVEISYQSTG